MPGRQRELKVVVLGDASQAQRALGKLDASVAKTEGSVTKAQGRLAKFGPAIAGGAAIGGAAILKLGGDAIAAAGEAQKVEAQTRSVIRSTGQAANVTAREVADLAGELKDLSGVEDEAIQSGQNMLLTFTNIRNEAGAGNDVFDQATRTLLDMSVAMGTDMSSQAVQLGKALKDPIAGISALSRVGVTFTEEQKATIASLVETGNVAGAQKVILAELNREFGGSAAAAGEARTSLERLNEKLGEMQEQFGGWLIDRLADFEEGLGDFRRGLDVVLNWEAKGTLGDILDGVGTALDAIEASAVTAYSAVKRLLDLPGDLVDAGVKQVKGEGKDGLVERAARTALKSIPGPVGDLIKSIPGFHTGGPVVGSGREVPAVLEQGEFVLRREAVRRVGVEALERLNAGRYHDGGPVGTMPAPVNVPPSWEQFEAMARRMGGTNVTIHQTIQAADIPVEAALEQANRELGWTLARMTQRSR